MTGQEFTDQIARTKEVLDAKATDYMEPVSVRIAAGVAAKAIKVLLEKMKELGRCN